MKKKYFFPLSLVIISSLVSCAEPSFSDSTTLINTSSTSEDITSDESSSSIIISENELYNPINGVNYGETERVKYHSSITNNIKHATVTLPYNYTTNKKYPVLYLLHGLAGNEYSWINSVNAKYIIQNLQYFYNVPEMIIVGVNSLVNEDEKEPPFTSKELSIVYDKTKDDLTSSLMPYIKDNYSILEGKENTALAGYSMGGRETIYTGFSFQNVFGYLGAFSSANLYKNVTSIIPGESIIDEFKIDENSDGFNYILLTIGKSDMMTNGATQNIHKKLTSAKIEHEYMELDGGHDFNVWKKSLLYFTKHLFKK